MPTVHAAATVLLIGAEGALDDAGRPVCRSFVTPGVAAPWDVCCPCTTGEGQLWVAVEQVVPTDAFPMPQTEWRNCPPAELAATLTVGVLRCAATVDDRGDPPDALALTADAEKVAADRETILTMLVCDPPSALAAVMLVDWTPLGPDGGCVGGLWRIRTLADICC